MAPAEPSALSVIRPRLTRLRLELEQLERAETAKQRQRFLSVLAEIEDTEAQLNALSCLAEGVG